MMNAGMILEVYRSIRFNISEILWAQTWNDTKKDIVWMQNLPGISPGRWAVGYNYLYVMTRILNEMEPHSVLDLGLGISSTLISNYFDHYAFSDGVHTVVERDEDWIRFYLNKHPLSSVSEIIRCEYVKQRMSGKTYTAFADFREKLSGRKYSVISIDAPEGSVRHSRRDIVQMLPRILEKSFVNVIDDPNRRGEKDTILEIKECLSRNGVEFFTGNYESCSDCCVIASTDNKLFCTM